MIDGMSAKALDDIEARVRDMSNQFKPGYIPARDEDRAAAGVRAVKSLDPLHAVAPEGTLYAGLDAQGRRFFSRDGAFAIRDGKLRMRDGSSVLGYPAGGEPGTLAPLRLNTVDDVLGRVSDAKLEADGTLAYTRSSVDPQTGATKLERIVVGQVALARFAAGTRVDAADGIHVTAPAGVEPNVGRPGTSGFGRLLAQSDDRGGIDVSRGLSGLRDAFLAFNAMQSAKNAHGHTDKVAMDLLK